MAKTKAESRATIDEAVTIAPESLTDAQALSVLTAAGARAPQQARGKARVEVILDAAATLVLESGLAAVTMHKVAKQAKTPIGSMYHFFPDSESLMMALRNRHQIALEAIDSANAKITIAAWRAFSPAEAIYQLLTPYIEYMEGNPDCLIILHALPSETEYQDAKEERIIRQLRKVVDARMPRVKPADRAIYSEMLHSLAVGSMRIRVGASHGDPRQANRYLREMRRALTAYLTVIESEG